MSLTITTRHGNCVIHPGLSSHRKWFAIKQWFLEDDQRTTHGAQAITFIGDWKRCCRQLRLYIVEVQGGSPVKYCKWWWPNTKHYPSTGLGKTTKNPAGRTGSQDLYLSFRIQNQEFQPLGGDVPSCYVNLPLGAISSTTTHNDLTVFNLHIYTNRQCRDSNINSSVIVMNATK